MPLALAPTGASTTPATMANAVEIVSLRTVRTLATVYEPFVGCGRRFGKPPP